MERTQITPEQAERLRITQGFAEPWHAEHPVFHGCAEPPVLLPSASTMRDKAKDLLKFALERRYLEQPMPAPTAKGNLAEDDSVWERTEVLMDGYVVNPKRLRHDMATELVALRGRIKRKVTVQVPNPDTQTVEDVTVIHVTSTAVRELKRLSRHVACKRVALCTKCALKADDAGEDRPLGCGCPSKLQRWLWKFIRQVENQSHLHRWSVTYVLLIVRDIVSHWQENRLNVQSARDAVPKLYTELDREAESMTGRDMVEYDTFDDDGKFVETKRFRPTDGTTRSALDLRGWDRPTSMGRRTQRLAFCPTCMVHDDPWFLVARSKPFGEAKCTHVVDGKECGTTEVTPPQRDPAKRPPMYSVTRKRRVHGKVELVRHVFYRQRGRWYADRTNELVHVMLAVQLERRWLEQLKQRQA